MDEKRKPLHEQPKLCRHILSSVASSSIPLRIAASPIPKAGSGLFAINDVAAGSEIFRSQPVLVVCEGNSRRICDYCFLNLGSSLHPQGRFYVAGERERVALSACTGCKNVEYCSKDCQTKAWRSYHKYECSIIKEVLAHKKIMGAVPHALARLLLWVKMQVISEDDFNAVVALEHHFDERNDEWLAISENNDTALLDPALETAYHVKKTVNSTLGLGQVHKMLCILLHNAGAIRPPEMGHQYGTFLDLVISTVNHCCEPNAHAFFEGRELRCRALKAIPAGTEITLHYYPTPRFDVLLRRSILDKYMYFNCNCPRCKNEITEHIAEAPRRQDHLGQVKKAQDKLDKLGKDAVDAFKSSRVLMSCISFQEQIAVLVEKGYPGGRWPDHVEPLPHTLRILGDMYSDLQFAVGLEFLLKGTLYVRDKTDPVWMSDLLELIRFMFFMAQAGDNELQWVAVEDIPLLGRGNMRFAVRGYLIILCLGARRTFGMDSNFVQALYHWAGESLYCHDDPKIHTDLFREDYEKSQKMLLTWAKANLDHGLELPSREQVSQLEKDIQALKSA